MVDKVVPTLIFGDRDLHFFQKKFNCHVYIPDAINYNIIKEFNAAQKPQKMA